ncbi:MAG: site-specific DNA-methyltransferase [Candidatus Uhrbacteria bacterium]
MSKKNNYDDWSKDELIKEIVKIKSTTYGLVWHRDLPEEKIDILINSDARTPNEMFPNEVAGKPFPVLKEIKKKAIESDKSKLVNILIEGDNYHSLAVLNFTHQESIDLIYIDPPYNTGHNDFIYNDKFIDIEDPFRHSKWLSFMEKRLKLSRFLLKKDGAIFISIDDNELAPLKMLCDEIFGENNFISMLSVENNPKGRKNSDFISVSNDYCLIYAKDKNKSHFIENIPKQFSDLAIDENGVYVHNSGKRVLVGENKFNPIVDDFNSAKHYSLYYNKNVNKIEIKIEKNINQTDEKLLSAGYKRYYSYLNNKFVLNTYTKSKIIELFENGALEFKNESIYEKNFSTKIRLKSLIINKKYEAIVNNEKKEYEIDVKTTSAGAELKEVFGIDKVPFSNPKNTGLIKILITLFESKSITILDFFAGSGTTGHAVLKQNVEDGGNRRFILCTNNENNICTEVCYPRVCKVISGYKTENGEKIEGTGGNLKYYTTDFVEAEPTDKNKRKLVKESTDMLCILENAFELIQETSEFKIFKNTDKYVGVIFYEEAIEDYKKAIKKIEGYFNTYVFSMGDDPHTKKFTDVKSKVTLCAIPEVILKVYREIFK